MIPSAHSRLHLSHIETCWIAPWQISRVSRLGRVHWSSRGPYQDAALIGNHGTTFWLVLADGISTAACSEEGSRLAVLTIDAVVGEAIAKGARPSKAILADAFDQAHRQLVAHASQCKRPVSDFGTTLVAALVHGPSIFAAAIGDSSAVLYCLHEGPDGQEMRNLVPFCTAPQTGKSGGTYSIGNAEHRRLTRIVETHSPAIRAVLLATDGSNDFFLRPAVGVEQHAFDTTYLDGIEPWLRHPETGLRNFCNYFGELFYKAEADDDQTLLLAYRLPADLAPPAL